MVDDGPSMALIPPVALMMPSADRGDGAPFLFGRALQNYGEIDNGPDPPPRRPRYC